MATFSVDDLAQHAGTDVERLEELSRGVLLGNGLLFESRSHRKRRGGIREIVKPNPWLDSITKSLNRSFLQVLPYLPPDHVHGFVRSRSTITNATAHLGKKCVLRVDLEDFFPSIGSRWVNSLLQQQGYDEKAASLCVGLTTIAGKLPIGLSTSPFLSNLAFQETDSALAEFSATEGLSFTRYVDDLVFSGDVTDEHLSAIEGIISNDGWLINLRKTAFMRRGGPQYVTGLYVGGSDMPRIPREMKRYMRWTLHIIRKFGYESYMADFGGEASDMRPQRLLGWARYITAVEPEFGRPLLGAFFELIPLDYCGPDDCEDIY
ncbi:reverse transcriptase family protein [Catenuloplanes japonicus]|uniref:reverse transcriptase family protein n=1 Tax=Catenuloplanes japonicus TaxID=33876 RepID=UPI0018DB9CFB|nr:reverse transcriptase family protein [Catenuloplanes japonicus]